MTCDRELLTTRELDDPELLAHADACEACRDELARLGAVLEPFHQGLRREPAYPLPTDRPWRSTMSKLLVLAASLSVISLTVLQSSVPQVQPGSAPVQVFRPDLTLVESAEKTPWNAISEQAWMQLAKDLEVEARQVVQRQPDTEAGLRVLVQTARSAENSNQPSPPFYDRVQGRPVNVYYLEAARVVHRQPALLATIGDDDSRAVVELYLGQLEQGTLE